ncbi:hypothetical protein BDD39_000023 [Saccharococcus thermophilus]|uniref:Uncharacterized protein n=1 Tax=Saccharococcus thermophilus TaxID=29396 RepID=A0A846MDV7_9BACL|nr:hypothetical protein [Saccharococcus thermophilus]
MNMLRVASTHPTSLNLLVEEEATNMPKGDAMFAFIIPQ